MNFTLEKEVNILHGTAHWFIYEHTTNSKRMIYSSSKEEEAKEMFERIKKNPVFIHTELIDEWHPDSPMYF
jgi:hypothetical protein